MKSAPGGNTIGSAVPRSKGQQSRGLGKKGGRGELPLLTGQESSGSKNAGTVKKGGKEEKGGTISTRPP